MHNALAILENSLAASYKIELALTTRPSNPAPGYLLETKIVCLPNDLHVNVYGSFLHNHPKPETIHMSSVGERTNNNISMRWNTMQ